MKKGIFIVGLLALSIMVSSLNAKEFDLRANMMKLNSELNNLQRGFITSDRRAVEIALDSLEKDAQDLLGDDHKMMKLLPKDMKNKKHKVNIAHKSARAIRQGAKAIRKAIADKGKFSLRKRQARAQEAYLSMVNACFTCHNLVRDKGRMLEK